MGTEWCPGILRATAAVREVSCKVSRCYNFGITNICINYSFEHYDRIKWLVEKIRAGDTSFSILYPQTNKQQQKNPHKIPTTVLFLWSHAWDE